MTQVVKMNRAVVEALVYFELFGFAPRREELHRMVGIHSPFDQFCLLLEEMGDVVIRNGFVALSGSEHLISRRQEGYSLSVLKVHEGREWGRRIGGLPGVLAVFLTGSVAAGNGREEDDLDYLVLAMPGRVWLVRLILYFASRVWKSASRLCLNYIIEASDDVMEMDHNLYVATELALMVPVYDEGLYIRFMRQNGWRFAFRPNSVPYQVMLDRPSLWKRLLGIALSFPLFGLLDWLEMRRASSRIRSLPHGSEVAIRRDTYKGHFSNHGSLILGRYHTKLMERFNEDCKD